MCNGWLNASMSKQLPTPSETQAALYDAFMQLIKYWKKKGKGQEFIAERIEVEQSYVSNVCTGRKNLGDDIVKRLDAGFPGWRDIQEADMTNTVSEPKSKYVTEPLQEYDENRRQLLYFYDGMSQGHQEAIVMTANGLYSMDNPHDRLAKPFGALPWDGKERRKGVLYGEIDLSGVKENVRKDNRVSKSSDDQRTGRPAPQGKKKTA
jgi:hypothetical protein